MTSADFHGVCTPTAVNFKMLTFKHLTSKIPECLAIGCQEPGRVNFGTALLSLTTKCLSIWAGRMPSGSGFDSQGKGLPDSDWVECKEGGGEQ